MGKLNFKRMDEIEDTIEKHYKGVKIAQCIVEEGDNCVSLSGTNIKGKGVLIAKRILEKYNDIKWVFVHEIGCYLEHVYSRESLRWAGYIK